MHRLIGISFALLFSLSLTTQLKAEKIEMTSLIKDLVVTKKFGDNMKQILLLPREYWRVALGDTAVGDEKMISQIEAVLEDYLVLGVTDANISTFGALKSNEVELVLVSANYSKSKPIQQKHLAEELSMMLDILRPAMVAPKVCPEDEEIKMVAGSLSVAWS